MAKRALAIKEVGGEFFLHEARGGAAVGEPVAGPFADRVAADAARTEEMRRKVRPQASPKPLRHSPRPGAG